MYLFPGLNIFMHGCKIQMENTNFLYAIFIFNICNMCVPDSENSFSHGLYVVVVNSQSRSLKSTITCSLSI